MKPYEFYDLINYNEKQSLARKLKSVLISKGYTIDVSQIIDALNTSSVKVLKRFDNNYEINFTIAKLLNSLNSESIVAYFLSPFNTGLIHTKVKSLLSVIVQAHVWLRDNNGDFFNIDVLKRSLILENIEKELLLNEKLPNYLKNNILSYLNNIPDSWRTTSFFQSSCTLSNDSNKSHVSTINKNLIMEVHGYIQMNLIYKFSNLSDQIYQICYNSTCYNEVKLLAYELKIYFKNRKYNIKHNDLIEAIVIANGYKNYHTYSSEYKIINKSHLYNNKLNTVNDLLKRGLPNQIMDAIISYMHLDENNIRAIHLIQAITNVLVHIRETDKAPIIFSNIIELLDIDILQRVIEKYTLLNNRNSQKIYSAITCFNEYTQHIDPDNKKLYELLFQEKHIVIVSDIIQALKILELKGVK